MPDPKDTDTPADVDEVEIEDLTLVTERSDNTQDEKIETRDQGE